MNRHFSFYNPNPNQKFKKDGTPMCWHGTDCTVRSLAKAMNWSWLTAYNTLCDEGRRQMMTYDDIKVLKKVWESLGFTKGESLSGVKPSVNQFCKTHPTGKFVLSIIGHVVTVEDGKFYDTWDCGNYKVRSYYTV